MTTDFADKTNTSDAIIVTSLRAMREIARVRNPSHIITLLAPDDVVQSVDDIPHERHLKLGFHDIHELMEGHIAPDEAVVEAIIGFGRAWDESRPLLIHCWAGISRSSAAAFIVASERNPGHEAQIARVLRERAPFATPNRLMIALADKMLARNGRMIAAVEEIGRGVEAYEGVPYALPARWTTMA